eukprot:2678-Prymnesium_polylepis.1
MARACPTKLRTTCPSPADPARRIRKAKRSTSRRPSVRSEALSRQLGVLRSALGDWTSTISLAAVVALRECAFKGLASAVIVSSVP